MSYFYTVKNYFGHLLPGTFFLIWSLWTLWNIFGRYYRALANTVLGTRFHPPRSFQPKLSSASSGKQKLAQQVSEPNAAEEDDDDDEQAEQQNEQKLHRHRREQLRYHNSIHYPFVFWQHMPVEAMVRAHLSLMWVVRAAIHAYHGPPSATHPQAMHYTVRALHHGSIYFGYLVAFTIEAFTYKRWAPRVARALPRHAEYFALVLALFNQTIVFWLHLSQQHGIAVRMHELHLILLSGTVIATVFECACPHAVGAAIARGFFMLMQAFWLYFEDTVVEPEIYKNWFVVAEWKDDNEDRMMMVLFFTVLLVFTVVVIAWLHAVVVVVQRFKYGAKTWAKIMDAKDEMMLLQMRYGSDEGGLLSDDFGSGSSSVSGVGGGDRTPLIDDEEGRL